MLEPMTTSYSKTITEEEYLKAQAIVDLYHEQKQREADLELEEDEEGWNQPEPCSVCGDVDGMINPCCPGYDPLHFKNCGYG